MGTAIQSAKVRAFSGTHPAIHSAQTPVAITNAGMIHHTAQNNRRDRPPLTSARVKLRHYPIRTVMAFLFCLFLEWLAGEIRVWTRSVGLATGRLSFGSSVLARMMLPTLPADPLFWHIAYRRKIINRRQDGTRASPETLY
jgi:hypothetical protein